ncbi:pseudaminic acid cytidylyltransferase [Pseudomonas sp. BIGb0427]|uniref:Pseudaminic acid cytidylyltransferase n=1 Tax=Pseudomonas vranovensis TaxID=321661 RepID=A0A423D4L4_9PSED|nr:MULTISPECIES: pseudaminic acid cytidylyltransferase [Pseudomonas]KJK19535.1 NeuA [Pseudomonas sp. 2(2015)]NLU58822.1 pseudaminic acid cytidylyltransferase [Pseudomonas sp. BIGb0427]QPG63128.1 pseudaminic acid cytidylyltransferase [Pseudomonas sp. BIGb0427]ROL66506.1 pseudaminic acid cytidylyltransferase [Pseudomonas vranovensis]UVL60307.1 pseudaminic acid cytidylyltransferase [Pseudomonas sp. B21-032]
MKLAVIPARGGSKRIARKNIKMFCGKPMIAWSIEAALNSGVFDRVIVSTDDLEIAEVARQSGAQVPFIRPAQLADDHSGTVPVIQHAIEWFEQDGQQIDYLCCLYATAPFVRPEDLQAGLDALIREQCDFAFAVTRYAFPVQRAVRINTQGRIEMIYPEQFNTRSQDLQETFHDAGQFYWGRTQAWRLGKPVFGPGSVPVVLPGHRVQDIDTLEDWVRAEWMFREMNR